MNTKPLSEAQDEDARQVMAALQRAAIRARQLAVQTQTAVVVMRDGKITRQSPTHHPLRGSMRGLGEPKLWLTRPRVPLGTLR